MNIFKKDLAPTQMSKNQQLLFVIGIISRIVFGLFFLNTSPAFLDNFQYVANFDIDDLNNVYSSRNENISAFPYPSILLYLLATVNFISSALGPGAIYFQIIFMLALFLFMDLSILKALSRWLGSGKNTNLMTLYWLSPVLIYLTYISGSMDIIVLCFFFLSLQHLFKNNLRNSSIFLGLALSTKTVIILTFPFIFFYMLSKRIIFSKIIIFFTFVSLVFIILNIQFISNLDFFNATFINSGQTRVLEYYLTIGDQEFYLIPAMFILLIFNSGLMKNFNRDTFIMYLAFAFGLFLIFIKPEEHWYFWLLPHLIYFYAKIEGRSYYLLYALQIIFFLYFFQDIFVSSMQPELSYLAEDLIFTTMVVILLCNIFWVYFRGIEAYRNKKLFSKPFIVGIGGNSGSGKTMLANTISQIFSKDFSIILNGDDMHKWKRGDLNWNKLTHLNPKANSIHEEIKNLESLKNHSSIKRKVYNHETGDFDKEININPKNLIIYEGLHPFFLADQRNIYDLRIMLVPDKELNEKWKITRDTEQRKKSIEEVKNQIGKRDSDVKKFIEPQISHADIIIRPFLERKKSIEKKLNSKIYFEVNINLPISLDALVDELQKVKTIKFDHKYKENGSQVITFEGNVSKKDLAKISFINQDILLDLGIDNTSYPEDLYGLVSMLVAFILTKSAK